MLFLLSWTIGLKVTIGHFRACWSYLFEAGADAIMSLYISTTLNGLPFALIRTHKLERVVHTFPTTVRQCPYSRPVTTRQKPAKIFNTQIILLNLSRRHRLPADKHIQLAVIEP